jgi:hypothetical protein
MTRRETGGPGEKRSAVEVANVGETEAPGIGRVLVIRAGLSLLGRIVRGIVCGTGALTTQQSFAFSRLGDCAAVCLQQPCCWGMGAATQTSAGATNNSTSTVHTARECRDFCTEDEPTLKMCPCM